MKKRVLIVEDENIVAEDLRGRIENKGFEVSGIASSGKAAIQEVKKQRPDLILMDVRIQGDLNGIETAIVIQSLFDEPVPIIFLTGFEKNVFPYLKVVEEYVYINKPFTEEVLFDAMARALHKDSVDSELS